MLDPEAVKLFFDQAAELPPDRRRSFLDEACEDPDVRRRVLQLLEKHETATGFMDEPAFSAFESLTQAIAASFDEFRIIREIGRGGMGVVYLAEDSTLQRPVALKILNTHAGTSENAIGRFKQEAKAAARLSHAGIVPVYRYGEQDGAHYIAMEYVEGETLESRIKRLKSPRLDNTANATRTGKNDGPNEANVEAGPGGYAPASRAYFDDCARCVSAIADALEYAHRNEVIHRDIKPSNIIIKSDGSPCITDFGIAKILSDVGLTQTGGFTGTAAYMSPEQASLSGGKVDHRTDVFSLGIVLYELLTLHRPFDGDSLEQIVRALHHQTPRAVRKRNPAISKDLETICHKAIEKDPVDRYQSAGHLAADLQSFLRGDPVLARPPGLLRRSTRFALRHRGRVAVATILILLALVASIFVYARNLNQQQLAHVEVTSTPPNANIYLRTYDDSSGDHGPFRDLGSSPLQEGLSEGLYHFVAIAQDSSFSDVIRYISRDNNHTDSAAASSTLDFNLHPNAPNIHANMVLVPGGEIVNREGNTLTIPDLWVDQYEVSNEDYLSFIESTGYPTPYHWDKANGLEYDPNLSKFPIVGISIEDALAFSLWAGKRLPTEWEWEWVMRQPDRRLLPWVPANEDIREYPESIRSLLPEVAPGDKSSTGGDWAILLDRYRKYMRPVDSQPELATPMGIFHAYGNASEMTASIEYRPYPLLIRRGVSWLHARTQGLDLRDASSSGPNRHIPLLSKNDRQGFRCVRPAQVAFPGTTKQQSP